MPASAPVVVELAEVPPAVPVEALVESPPTVLVAPVSVPLVPPTLPVFPPFV
jgi:hypothetical protein